MEACEADLAEMHLAASEALVVPHHKRLVAAYETNAAGAAELHLYFGEQEIVFDEPALFGFGDGLVQHAQFIAGDAARWGCDWSVVQPLLEQLLQNGLLRKAADAAPACMQGLVESPLPPASGSVPRSWSDGAALMLELTGRALEPGYLELVVPVYRVAHPLLDTEGRQVGEANVFPAPLRLAVATDWRTCQHAGSRYQDEQPMNVSALRSMIRHWKPAMALLLRLRHAYLERFPAARQRMTVGDLQRLSSLVLALPAYLAMKADRPLANGELDPVLSSLFRVTDGVRMVMHRMMFTAEREPSRAPEAAIDAAAVYAYSERNTAFLSDHGVCAGPKMMIEEFLRVLVEGRAVDGAEAVAFGPQIVAALDDLDAAIDYGLRGLQAYAVVFSLWPQMARAYERLAAAADGAAGLPLRWIESLRRSVDYLRASTRVKNEERRRVLEQAYAEMFARCAHGLGETAAAGTLPGLLAATDAAQRRQAWQRLRTLLPGAAGNTVLLDALADYLVQEQAVVRAALEVQARINRCLGRTKPQQPLSAADLALHYRLVAYHYGSDELRSAGGRLPYLVDELEQALGLRVRVTAAAIEIDADGPR